MLCPFPDGSIPIVYVNTFFAIFRYKARTSEGFIADFWKTAARSLHCDGVKFIHQPHYAVSCELYCKPGNCTCDGDLGMIERGEAFSIVDVRSYNKMRLTKFRYTFPIDLAQYAFFEGRPVTRELSVSIHFFIVFPTSTFVFIVISIAAFFLIRLLERRVFGFVTYWKGAIVLSLTFIISFHSAVFQGNNIVARNHKPRTFAEAITAIQTGRVAWGTRGEMIRESAQILGRGSSFLETDIIKMADAVCHNESVIGSFFVKELYEVPQHPQLMRTCDFYKIPNTGVGLTHSFEPQFRSFLMPKATPKWIVEQLNFLVLSLFQYDHREGPYLRRYTLGRSFTAYDASPKSLYSPINIALFKSVFILCGGLLLLSLSVFLLEMPFHRMKPIGYRVFPSKHSESIRRSKALFHYELPTARRAVIDYDYRQYVAPKISHSDYKVTTVPSRIIDEPDYDRDEEERLSGKGTPDRLLPLSRPPSSSSLDRPPHRTNPISASTVPSLGGTIERHDAVERRSTGASNGNLSNGTSRNTGYYMERERFNGLHGRSHALETMERETNNGFHGRSSAIATNSVDRPQHAATYHPASNSSSRRHTGSSVSISDNDPALLTHRSLKMRDGYDRHPEVRDVIDQSEEILEDLDSMLEEHLSFDEARRKIMDQNLSFRQYAKMPYDDENNYEIIEEIYERRITKERTIVHLEEDEPRVELHRDEIIVHRGEGDTVRVKDPEVADRMKRLVNGRRGTISPPLFQDIIVEDIKKASKHGVREANAHRRRKAEEVYEWTLSEIDRLERALAPEYCIQHIPVYAKDNFTRIPEWKRRLVAKKLSQESIREETHRLWDEFDEWLRVNDPTWKPAHSEINDRPPMIR